MKESWVDLLGSLEIDDWQGPIEPVSVDQINHFESKHEILLPDSYRQYCMVFGAGEIAERFEIAVPGFKGSETCSLDSLRTIAHAGQEEDVYSADPDQHKRGIFFCIDVIGTFHFFDPHEVTDRRANEYAVYSVFRNYETLRSAENFWDFITLCCLGERWQSLMKGRPPKRVFMPIHRS